MAVTRRSVSGVPFGASRIGHQVCGSAMIASIIRTATATMSSSGAVITGLTIGHRLELGQGTRRQGFDKPAEAHLALRAKKAVTVFGEGGKPGDEGIIESRSILGSIA